MSQDNVPQPPAAHPQPQQQPPTDKPNQYDLGDTNADTYDVPTVPAGVTPAVDDKGTPVPAPATPPRGPDGRFLPPAAATPPAPEPPKHSRRNLRLAREFGIPDRDVQAMTPEDLDDEIYARVVAQRADFAAKSHDNVRLAGDERTPEERAAGVPLRKPEAPADKPLFDDETLYDEGIVAAVKGVNERLEKRIGQLESELRQFRQAEQARSMSKADQRIDQAIEKLGPAYEHIVGKGGLHQLGKSAEAQRRRTIVRAAGELAGPRATIEDVIDAIPEAAQNLYGAFAQQPPPAGDPPADDAVKRWQQAGVARPTNRLPSQEPPGPRRAVAAAQKFLSESGLADDTDLEAFPS